jgi:lipoprotein-anchoring transpeptidase ErfK/SrfK
MTTKLASLKTATRHAVVALVLGAVAVPVFSPGASAATAKATKAKTSSSGRVPTRAISDNPCPTVKGTSVAAMKKGKTGDFIKIWEKPDDTLQPRWTLGIGETFEFRSRVVFTILAEENGWLLVNVPARPNASVGYIKANEVTRYVNPFYLVLELNKRRLTVCNQGRVIMQEKAGIGNGNDPTKGATPLGTFHVVDLFRPKGGKNGPFGPFAFGLSGFSETLFDYNGGDGRLGIHGTNNPKALGTQVSHGCIRISNAAITKLSKTLWLGAPIKITN